MTSASDQPEARSGLEPWTQANLPQPPLSKGLRIFAVIGPGAILLGTAIGGGEWLLGPATFVKYGMTLLWVTAVAVFMQTVLNMELIRYTLYTGEPAVIGFMRTKPRATFWACIYAGLYFLQFGWPAFAGAAAGAIFFLFTGSLAGESDAPSIYAIGVGTYLACVFILLFAGKRIERTLEILNWILVAFILVTLLLLCIALAGPDTWIAAAAGLVGFDPQRGAFSFIPSGADWFLIGAFAAYSGAGGAGNLTLSNWARDKGFGMSQLVGFIPTAVAGQTLPLAHTGKVFPPTAENLAHWRGWWRIVRADQWGVFFIGALLGMVLPAILYTAALPAGEDIRGLGIAARLADALSQHGALISFLVAFMGAWVLFKTQLDILEGTVRAVTDIVWSGSVRARRWSRGDVRWVYYTVLAGFVGWGIIAIGLAQPIVLIQLGANVVAVVMMISALHILYVNTKFLPIEIRPPLWRRIVLIAMVIFYGFFVCLWLMGVLLP